MTAPETLPLTLLVRPRPWMKPRLLGGLGRVGQRVAGAVVEKTARGRRVDGAVPGSQGLGHAGSAARSHAAKDQPKAENHGQTSYSEREVTVGL